MRTKLVLQAMLWLVLFTFTAGLSLEQYMSGNYYSQASAEQGDGIDKPRKNKRRGPPEEAIAACGGLNEGEVCSFESPRGDLILGTCELTRAEVVACVPEGGPPHRPDGPHGELPPPSEDGER